MASKGHKNESNFDKSWLDLQFHDDDKQNIKKPDELGIDLKDNPPSQSDINDLLIDRIQGSIIGMAIGDALGAHVEFRPHTYLEANPVKDLQGGGTWGLEKGQFTDDTSMALCLANSLIVCQDFVPYDQLVRYTWWYRKGYMSSTGHCFDIGAATRQSLQEFESRQRKFSQDNDIPFNKIDSLSDPDLRRQFDVNCSKIGVAGNGALMRLAPVPLFFYLDPIKAVEYSGQSGRITHGDDKAYDACRYYGALIVATLQGKKKNILTSNSFYSDHKEWFGEKDLHPDILSIAQGSYKREGGYQEGIRGKGYIVSALEAALWAFWSDNDSFEVGALNAVNLGDDTDTTAAIYGQLAGAYYGYKHLPPKWSDLIYAKKFLLCVSNWIGYEGHQWFIKQNTFDVPEQLINSDPTTVNEKRDTTKISKQKCHLRNSGRSTSIISSIQNPLSIIERKAILSSGRIGFLYDGCQDHLVASPDINLTLNNNDDDQFQPITKCLIGKGNDIECQNLLRFLGFQDELRLSVMSNIILPKGIASVIEYPYLIDECTRILYYSLINRQDILSDNFNNVETMIEGMLSKSAFTHLITEVKWGIDLILILRLSSDQIPTIDESLNRMCQCLTNNTKLSDKISLDGILSTRVYSNIPHLNEQRTLTDVYHEICKIKNDSHSCQPLTYILRPIEEFCSYDRKSCLRFVPLKAKIVEKFEQYLVRFLSVNKMWRTFLDNQISDLFHIYLKDQLEETKNEFQRLTNEYGNVKKELKEFILNLRSDKYSLKKSNEHQFLIEQEWTILKYKTDDFEYSLTSLIEKRDFIIDLKHRGFEYYNAAKSDVKQGDDEKMIQQKLIKDNRQRILCSNDTLRLNNWQELNELCSRIMMERESDQNLDFIYADFSYSSYELNQMKIYPLKNYQINSEIKISFPLKERNTQHSSNDNIINIILLGKSRVGKSTLINTFLNYLKFDTYDKFRTSISMIDILISFLYPITNESEEHIVLCGKNDPNEDYHHLGQSVTQDCKSYIFDIGQGQKLRLIDTPGFGNTYDKDRNEFTMQLIISSIIDLTHLNAICVLLESNDDQVDVYQTCLAQLFDYLEDSALNNIIFCFTKSLSCEIDFSKKNHLLKSVLRSFSKKNICFNEPKTFVFDSSYFFQSIIERYSMELIGFQNQKYEQSWTIANNGWTNLLDYVCNSLQPYSIHQELQKAEYIRFEINKMIRPILETMRNIMRNQILSKTKSNNFSIELRPKPILHNLAICYSCARGCNQFNSFWIMSDTPHEYWSSCNSCSCGLNQHMQIDYRLDYELSSNRTNYQSSQMYSYQNLLLHTSVYFAQFLMSFDHSRSNDLFLLHINRMIDEERYICDNISPNGINYRLYKHLIKLRLDYQRFINASIQTYAQNNTDIDQKIENVKQIPMIKIQMDAIRKMKEISV